MTASTELGHVRQEFKRDKRRKALGAGLLMAPAVAFVCFTFISAIVFFLYKSIDNTVVPDTLPKTVVAMQSWSGEGVPDEATYAALADDLQATKGTRNLFSLTRRLNYQAPGVMTLMNKAARMLPETPEGSYKEAFIELDPKWGEPKIWQLIQQESPSMTTYFLRRTMGLVGEKYGDVNSAAGSAYATTMARTFWISGIVTLACLLLGYPLAYLLASARGRVSRLLLLGLVLTPFWTSLLVRTLAWIVIFAKDGIANSLLTKLGIIAEPISMLYTRGALYVGMTQILLPFMVLSIYSVMRGVSPIYTRAALSLGARPIYAFFSVYLPQTLPGVGAGIVLVGVLALGFYITPMFLGGSHDQMASYYIAYFTDKDANWGMAAALGVWLLAFTLIAFTLINRFIGINKSN